MTPPGAREKGITPEPPQSPRRLRAVQAAEAESAMRTPERSLHNLPSELSSFVGREKELAEVKRLLENIWRWQARRLWKASRTGCGWWIWHRWQILLSCPTAPGTPTGWRYLASFENPVARTGNSTGVPPPPMP